MPRLSRRDLMKSLGVAAAGLPMLDALGNRAFAAEAPKKRLVCIVLEHGIFAQHWLPFAPSTRPVSTDSPGSMLQAPSTFLRPVAFEQKTGCTAVDLMPYSGALSPILSAKWQPFKRKTAFINNLGCSASIVQGHTKTPQLGGFRVTDKPGDQYTSFANFIGESIDVTISRKLNGRLPLTLRACDTLGDIRALETSDYRGGQVSFAKNAMGVFEQLPFLTDPIKTWDRLFSSYMPPTMGPPVRENSARRVALLERALGSVTGITRDARLSTYDRQRLDQHAAFLQAQRDRIASTPVVPPLTPAAPPTKPGPQPADGDAFNVAKGRLYRAQFMNAAAAIKMGRDQVVTIEAGLENEWLTEGIALGGSQAYHGNAGHLANPSAAIIEECRKTQQFVFDSIADFLAELDTLEDPATGATYLDNTMVLITTEHDGRPNGHLRGAVSSILVGGFGTFVGGKAYDFSRPNLWTADSSCIYTGYSYTRLLHTLLAAFGVTSAERADVRMEGMTQTWQGSDTTDWNLPLTGLT